MDRTTQRKWWNRLIDKKSMAVEELYTMKEHRYEKATEKKGTEGD